MCVPITARRKGARPARPSPNKGAAMTAAPVRHEFVGMTGVVASQVMRNLLATVARVAQSKATVLITGESGVGKEWIARALHHLSARCARPWVDVNCGALPEHLVESELFGYEKGAFSGAATTKQGLFELAGTGTLFLDEIGELDPRMQVKLLRVLDGVPYYRLGGTRKVTADVRIVAATNQSLEEATRNGRFRKDLFYRLNQLRLRIPPLRERGDDIEALALYFLEQQAPSATLSAAALQALRAYDWPGNVRELRGVVTKAALLADDGVIGPAHLDWGDTAPPYANAHPPFLSGMNLEEMERALIMNGLAAAGGNQTKAAAMLGISSRTIARKLKTYGITADRQPAVACNGD
ncbi:MAG: sigma-54 dependent transcriptional regulator [Bryobacteraceae bacterium]|nr:sigma-54 dependent transcriptional regulator [Bryobacteraceae bacterium]